MSGRTCSGPRRRTELLRRAIQKWSVASGLVSLGLDPSKLTRSRRRYCIAVDGPADFVGGEDHPFGITRPTYADPRHAFSIRQHYLTPLDLMVAKTSRYLAIRTTTNGLPVIWALSGQKII